MKHDTANLCALFHMHSVSLLPSNLNQPKNLLTFIGGATPQYLKLNKTFYLLQ